MTTTRDRIVFWLSWLFVAGLAVFVVMADRGAIPWLLHH